MKRRPLRSSAAEQLRANRSALDYLHASMPPGSIDPMADFQPKPKREYVKKAQDCPSEFAEQSAVCYWWALACKRYGLPEFALYAVPNGGSRNLIEAVNLKRTGTRRGIPDLVLAVPVQDFHSCYIEMKRKTGGNVSPEQADVLDYLRRAGFNAVVCEGADAAIRAIEAYLARRVK